jgi:hypothetical protein
VFLTALGRKGGPVKRSFLATSFALAALALTTLPVAAAETVVVSPADMHGWAFFEDNSGGPGSGKLVNGPSNPPLGSGSAELSVTGPSDRQALGTGQFGGTRLADIKKLSYWSYQTDTRLAVSFQFDIHYTHYDTFLPYQGRLVFEPGGTGNGGIVSGWQKWDKMLTTGKWWATRDPGKSKCGQGAPCTWTQVKGFFPDAEINGVILFKVGGGWPPFKGNVDALKFGVEGCTTVFDFEKSPANGQGHHGEGSHDESC